MLLQLPTAHKKPRVEVPSQGPRSSQTLFKALCTRARFVCKSFDAYDRIREVKQVVTLLTKELLDVGSVGRFCASVRRFGRPLVLVNVDCDPDDLRSFGQVVDFVKVCGSTGQLSLMDSEQDSQFVKSTAPVLESGSGVTVVTGVTQSSLLQLCWKLSQQGPLLYAQTGFHFARSYMWFAATSGQGSVLSPGHMETCATTAGTVSPRAVAEDALQVSACSTSDPAFVLGTKMAEEQANFLVSVNSLGFVSSTADAILLESDLELLGIALELVSRKMNRVLR